MIERNITACAKPDSIDRASFAYGYACSTYDAHNHACWWFIKTIVLNKLKRILHVCA
jgi:hypothetical protein